MEELLLLLYKYNVSEITLKFHNVTNKQESTTSEPSVLEKAIEEEDFESLVDFTDAGLFDHVGIKIEDTE